MADQTEPEQADEPVPMSFRRGAVRPPAPTEEETMAKIKEAGRKIREAHGGNLDF